MRPYYQDSLVTIYHGDCREVLPQINEVDAGVVDVVVTSPPYNLGEGMEENGGLRVGHQGSKWKRGALRLGYGDHADKMPYQEYVAWQRETLAECWRIIPDSGAIYYNHKPRVVRGNLRLPTALIGDLPLRQIVIWDRGGGFNYMSGAYVPMHEWILVLAKKNFVLRDKAASGVGDVWRIAPEVNTPHPAPFPLELATRVVETTSALTFLDPFAGSGTTLVAAKNSGRKAIGIELNEAYCEIAAERCRQETLFGGEAA